MELKEKIKKAGAFVIRGLPLAGILYGATLPMQAHLQPFLILAALIWFQVVMLFEIFPNKS